MNRAFQFLGKQIASYLAQEIFIKGSAPPSNPLHLQTTLRPGDVLLVEGNTRVSTAIKYLTQSTWSHAALYVGSHLADMGGNPNHCLVEADTLRGVISSDLERYSKMHTRICRPAKIKSEECRAITSYAIEKIGNQYDLRNIFDLARYLFPTPPIPTRFRRRLLSLGSGDPSQAICSTLIAQAFESIHYPILADADRSRLEQAKDSYGQPQIFPTKHHSLFTPRDFDVSPYFQIVKPTIESGFDFHQLEWIDTQQ
ncbi:MAG: lipo-like protein [Betaproteobacteria bacterium]|jgi:hypothetical protein|nr:lipo-like protein [Betaproteobacteria bacterium]NBT66393.1 lipo-like protein [Betaproteobacteria bacterium]NBY07847.1 lipo-like protein [Betaproteobacteria bacterium]